MIKNVLMLLAAAFIGAAGITYPRYVATEGWEQFLIDGPNGKNCEVLVDLLTHDPDTGERFAHPGNRVFSRLYKCSDGVIYPIPRLFP